jgi:hypothetical protein
VDGYQCGEQQTGIIAFAREFLRGLSNRVLELGGESGTHAQTHAYPGSYVEYVERTGHAAPGVLAEIGELVNWRAVRLMDEPTNHLRLEIELPRGIFPRAPT